MRRQSVLVIFFAALGAVLAGLPLLYAAGRPEISVTVSPREVTIADPLTYTVRISAPADMELKPGDETTARGIFIVRRSKEYIRQKTRERIVRERVYELVGFDVGTQTIPAYTVAFRTAGTTEWQTAESEAVTVTIKSVLGTDSQPTLRPLKPKMTRLGRGLWLGIAVLMLTAAGIALGWWLQRRSRQQEAAAPPLPAHIIAFQELEELRQAGLVAQGKMEEFFARLSGCVRHYLENRFHLRAPQMSTEEFMETAKTSPLLQGEHKRLLRDFLGLADLVKFARYGSSPQEADQAYNAAYRFVEQTKEQPPVEAEKTI